MGFLSTLTNIIDKALDKILSPKNNDMMIGVPRYDNAIKIIDEKSMAKASCLLAESMGDEIKKIDRNQLFKEVSTILEFYRFLYGVEGNVRVDNNLAGFTFKFVCKSSKFLRPLYLELDRIFGDLYISIQYADNISVDDVNCWLSVMIHIE